MINTVDFGYKELSYIKDDFPVRLSKMYVISVSYKGLIDPGPTGPLYPKSTVQRWSICSLVHFYHHFGIIRDLWHGSDDAQRIQ